MSFVVSLRSDFTRSCLLHDWDSKPNISEQLGKSLLVSTSNESHAKGQHASLGERCDALQECQIEVKYPAFQGYQRCKIFTFVHHNQYQMQSMKRRGKVYVDFSSDRAEFVSWMGGRIFWKNLSWFGSFSPLSLAVYTIGQLEWEQREAKWLQNWSYFAGRWNE